MSSYVIFTCVEVWCSTFPGPNNTVIAPPPPPSEWNVNTDVWLLYQPRCALATLFGYLGFLIEVYTSQMEYIIKKGFIYTHRRDCTKIPLVKHQLSVNKFFSMTIIEKSSLVFHMVYYHEPTNYFSQF